MPLKSRSQLANTASAVKRLRTNCERRRVAKRRVAKRCLSVAEVSLLRVSIPSVS